MQTPSAFVTPPRAFEDDPAGAGWSSEVLSERAGKELNRVAAWLEHPSQAFSPALKNLATPSFHCPQLRPEDVTVVRDDPWIRVERMQATANSTIYRGPSGLQAALEELRDRYGSSVAVRVEFKIFGVNAASDSVTTRQYVSVFGSTEQGMQEEHSTWLATWMPEPEHLKLESLTVEDYERSWCPRDTPLFADCTEAVLRTEVAADPLLGHSLEHWQQRIPAVLGQSSLGYHGLAVGDLNGDGLDDVYLCNPGGMPNQLFLQGASGTVTESSARAGVDWMDTTMSALIVDLDNDGDRDLIVGSTPQMLLENDGRGHFEGRMMLPGPAVATSLAAADFDQDGLLDLYVCYYSNEGPLPYHDANNGPGNILWRNQGDWQFEDATTAYRLDQNNTRFSFAACWEDYDNDGDLDLYVANDYGRNNLYRNDRVAFRDVAGESGVEDLSAGMSVTFGDADHDGYMDLYVSNMFSSAGNRITYQRQFNPLAQGKQLAAFQRHARGNSLFFGRSDGAFVDRSLEAGVTMGRWAWCSLFVDVNNDTYQDLVVANGNLTNEDPQDL